MSQLHQVVLVRYHVSTTALNSTTVTVSVSPSHCEDCDPYRSADFIALIRAPLRHNLFKNSMPSTSRLVGATAGTTSSSTC